MDIIDIMLARAMTPQGQTETYVAIANAAAAKAEKAKDDADIAIATVEAAADEIATAKSEATDLLADAREALETAQAAQINSLDLEDVDDEVKKMTVDTSVIDSNSAKTIQIVTTYPDDTLNTQNVTKLYKSTGVNEDGAMTQKAITDALAAKADASALSSKADKTYVDQQIAQIPAGGGSGSTTINLDPEDAGHLVKIDENGNLVASGATDEAVIEALLQAGTYVAKDSVGLDVNYLTRTVQRAQEAINKTMGSDFDQYTMYGGRTKCNVADDGTINAFYGDNNYVEDGSNGQVMIYQPKFYYKRIIRNAEALNRGYVIRHEELLLSATPQQGFKLAPIFGNDLDYVLLPAYDGSLDNGRLCSVAGAYPAINMTIAQAESYANARGEGWHIMNMEAESANQMLEIVEFGTMNGQSALEEGITYSPNGGNGPFYFITGSTASLGNGTGHATSTQVDINGTISTMTENGKRAICYRGMENPWGNLWSMIGGINIIGNGSQSAGVPYICTNFNYTPGSAGSNYEDIGFNLSNYYNGWINAMGYGNEKYDWVYLPVECNTDANSLLPVGDALWLIPNLNGAMIAATGGSYGYKEACGPFYYALDRSANESARINYGAKLLYIPTKNETYEANIAKWNTYMGG